MISLFIPDIKDFTSQLFLKDSFDSFCFIEGDIVTFNTFHIDGFVQKGFFDTDTVLPEYSYWKNVREYCFNIIKGKRTPLSFRFIFSLSPKKVSALYLVCLPKISNDLSRRVFLLFSPRM